MDKLDRYAAVFVLAFALSTVAWGLKDCLREPERLAVLRQLKVDKKCWERKAQEHSFGYRDRRC